MCYRNLQGPTRLFRSAEQGGGPDAVNVVPVMVLQSALGVHIGNPQQLAIPALPSLPSRLSKLERSTLSTKLTFAMLILHYQAFSS